MRYILILALALATSCVKYDYNDYGDSIYECGIVVGGERRGASHWLLVEYPDGQYWEEVTEKAYYEYKLLDEICFDTIVW
jgi:hypothetical protein